MTITAPEPLADLEPILDPADTPKDIKGNPTRTWSSGVVAQTFFDKTLKWFNSQVWSPPGSSPIIPADILPQTPEVAGGRSGQRVWTLPDVERLAFHLFDHPRRPDYDVAALYRTLDVVYAVARLQGLLPRDADPVAQLRPAPKAWTSSKRSKRKTQSAKGGKHHQKASKATDAGMPLEQPTLDEAVAEAHRQQL